MILRVICRVLHELVDCALGEGEFRLEAIEVLDRVGLGEGRQEVDPGEGGVAEGEEDENFGTSEALVGGVARRSGRVGSRGELGEMVVILKDSRSGSEVSRQSKVPRPSRLSSLEDMVHSVQGDRGSELVVLSYRDLGIEDISVRSQKSQKCFLSVGHGTYINPSSV